jgi:histidyl-tRNA synthetase
MARFIKKFAKINSMKKIETANYKGVRDFYPRDMFIQDYIMSVWHDVLESYGFEHYSASILESSEIYETKTSQEIVNDQTYSFTDRGDRRVTLRPEMTPTVTRMVAKKQRELTFPLRWYSIPNVFRYEQPQKGRLREHWQLNVDVFGISNLNAESELIEISDKIMKKFGLKESDYVIKINDRKILDKMFSDLGLDKEKSNEFRRLLDKKDKINDFNERAEKILGRPFDLIIEPNSTVSELIEKLSARGIKNVVFDPNMVRGFDYYTGIVFEIFDTNPENRRSVFGGGRYDNLLEIFGGQSVPTVGFGMGDVTIRDILESRNLLPKEIAPAHIGICVLNNNDKNDLGDFAANIATQLRESGIDTIVNHSDKKVGDQIKYFDKNKVPFVFCIGEEEFKTGKFKVKNLQSGKEETLKSDDIPEFVTKELSR